MDKCLDRSRKIFKNENIPYCLKGRVVGNDSHLRIP